MKTSYELIAMANGKHMIKRVQKSWLGESHSFISRTGNWWRSDQAYCAEFCALDREQAVQLMVFLTGNPWEQSSVSLRDKSATTGTTPHTKGDNAAHLA